MNRGGETDCARRLLIVALLALMALPLVGSAAPASAADPVTVTDYTDPAEALRWGQRSHWKQPWRSYLETVPATTMLEAIGINFNVKPKFAEPTARLLAAHGFQRARIEVGWGSLEYDDPTRIAPLERRSLETTLTALQRHGIRPLILLNSNHGKPCPVREDRIELRSPAAAGATEIEVATADLATIIPGRTGIDSDRVAAATLFAAVEPDGTVRLSRPLAAALPAGELDVTTLRYEPFRQPRLADGSPNPRFEPTMQGWLGYVGTVSREVEAILGSEQFDVEIWNELSFGSAFLNVNLYYEPDIEWKTGRNFYEILGRSVGYLRDPAHGVPGIGIGNGFASQSPWWSGSEEFPGVTAIDKHPYAGWKSFPEDAVVNGNRPLDGRGEPAGWQDRQFQWHEDFTPSYEAFFPEHFLSAIQTETMVRDLSPEPTPIQDTLHGRSTHPPGAPPPQVWITEVNLGPGSGPTHRDLMTEAERRRIATKDALRYLAAYVNKGVSALYFYAATAGDLSLVDPAFFEAAKRDLSTYPGDELGGETLAAVGRFAAAMRGGGPLAEPRRLSLRALTDYAGRVQFEGNGTAAYPPLHDRDVLAFLPFQVSDDRFVVPVYVMTRNVAAVQQPGATDGSRFDLPAEPYELTIGGVEGETAVVGATDPLSGAAVPVEVVARGEDEVVVRLGVTDSPRLLTIEDSGYEPPPGEGTSGGEVTPEPELSPLAEGPAPAPVKQAKSKVKPAAPAEPAPPAATGPLAPRLRLAGGRKLLGGGRMAAVASCSARCEVALRGSLLVGASRYPLTFAGGRERATAARPARVLLALEPGDVRRALRGQRRGAAVTAVVSARASSPAAAAAETARAELALDG